MRSITNAAQAQLSMQYGSEPVFVVGVDWSGTGRITYYADRTIYDDNGSPIIYGKILDINNVESVLNINGNNISISIDVTLDDSDEEFLNLFNNTDIHRKQGYLYQYFEGLTIKDMFLLFQGYVVSEIMWSDKDKTFKISIASLFENYEAGFSPEEGDVSQLREDLVGIPWPMGFGTLSKAPTIRITDIPVNITTEPMGFHDYWLDWQIIQLKAFNDGTTAVALLFFLEALGAYFSDDTELGDQLTDQGNQILLQQADTAGKLADMQALLAQQVVFEKDTIIVLTDYPIKLKGVFEAAGIYLTGVLTPIGAAGNYTTGEGKFKYSGPYHNLGLQSGSVGSQDNLGNIFSPTRQQLETMGVGPTEIGIIKPQTGVITDLQGAIQRDISAFRYIPAGSHLTFLGDYPTRYVVNIIGSKIINLYAHRTFGGYTRPMLIPKSYYKTKTFTVTASRQLPFRSFSCIAIEMFRPLSTLLNQHWDDNEVFASYTSSVGPGFRSIMRYIVLTFTVYGVDDASLNTIPDFNLNFVLMELKESIKLIQEICFQCKVAATVKNGKFYFTYLPYKSASVATITLNDLIEDSLEFSFIHTENMVTKMIGTWKRDWSDPKKNRVVIRYNIFKYGTIEEEHDFYCFNDAKAVEASMSFWLYRKGNSWKRLKIQVPLKLLGLEIFDIINLGTDFTSKYGINNGGVTPAVVMNSYYDVSTNIITLELELPIKLGENTVDKNYWPSGSFAWMGAGEVSQILETQYPQKGWNGISETPLASLRPIFDLFGTGSGGGGGGISVGNFSHQSLNIPNDFTGRPSPPTGDYGGTLGDYVSPQMKFTSTGKTTGIGADLVPPRFPLRYGDPATSGGSTGGASNVILGQVLSGTKRTYMVNLFANGYDNNSTGTITATAMISVTDTLPPKTAVLVIKTTAKLHGSGDAIDQYWLLPPVWA